MPADPPYFIVIVAFDVRLSTFVRVTCHIVTPGCETYRRTPLESGSADVTVTVTREPRRSVAVEVAIEKAFISTLTDWLIVTAPSDAVTNEVYVPAGRRTPSAFRPSQVQDCGPAARAASAKRVTTMAPAELRTVQVPVAGRARQNHSRVAGANRSASCGKKTYSDVPTALRKPTTRTGRVAPAPFVPALSRAVKWRV